MRIRKLGHVNIQKFHLNPMERVTRVGRHHAFGAEDIIAIARFAVKHDLVFAHCHPTTAAELPSIRPYETIAPEKISEIEIVIATETMKSWVLQVTVSESMTRTIMTREKTRQKIAVDPVGSHKRAEHSLTAWWEEDLGLEGHRQAVLQGDQNPVRNAQVR
jgi:hypothetical protein